MANIGGWSALKQSFLQLRFSVMIRVIHNHSPRFQLLEIMLFIWFDSDPTYWS